MHELVIAASDMLNYIVATAVDEESWPDENALLELEAWIRSEAEFDDVRALLMADGVGLFRQVCVLRSYRFRADALDMVAQSFLTEALTID